MIEGTLLALVGCFGAGSLATRPWAHTAMSRDADFAGPPLAARKLFIVADEAGNPKAMVSAAWGVIVTRLSWRPRSRSQNADIGQRHWLVVQSEVRPGRSHVEWYRCRIAMQCREARGIAGIIIQSVARTTFEGVP